MVTHTKILNLNSFSTVRKILYSLILKGLNINNRACNAWLLKTYNRQPRQGLNIIVYYQPVWYIGLLTCSVIFNPLRGFDCSVFYPPWVTTHG